MEEIRILKHEDDVKVQTTIGDLRSLYARGYADGAWPSIGEEPLTIKGEIIGSEATTSRV